MKEEFRKAVEGLAGGEGAADLEGAVTEGQATGGDRAATVGGLGSLVTHPGVRPDEPFADPLDERGQDPAAPASESSGGNSST